MTSTAQNSSRPPETTELERRVLAHERVLQALIAYMSRTEPRFVDHLRERFVESMKTARHEHDYRDVDDYAEEFIRAIMLIGGKSDLKKIDRTEGTAPGNAPTPRSTHAQPTLRGQQHDRVQLRERHGIWEVKVDGAFWGDYHQKDLAIAAVALAKLSL